MTDSEATTCTAKKCSDLNIGCGPAGDGCGGTLDCGTCNPGQQCGVDGKPSQCVNPFDPDAGGAACVPLTKADYTAQNKDCGLVSDGCGSSFDLGSCTSPEFCGGGGPSKCAVAGGGSCTKKTCTDYTGVCGPQPDGCGGVTADCGGCTAPEVCGGGGVASKCGGGTLTNGQDGGSCAPKTVADCAASQCGKIADGCGGVVDCGTTKCTAGQICGGGGQANVCGAPVCTPKTQAAACTGLNCGQVADGCGGILNCGTACTAPQVCGGGGKANICGGGTVTADGGGGGGTCTPKTAAACTAGQCGPFADGCGGTYSCGNTCPVSGDTCGGGGTASVCGGHCTPKTAAVACNGLNCGIVADGCGGTIGCWPGNATTGSCPSPGPGPNFDTGDSCGGGGSANVCGGGVKCTGTYCGTQPTNCPGGTNTTTLKGKVFAPNTTLPIFNANVYVPNTTLAAVPTGGTTCDACTTPSGSPFVTTTTAADGSFTLPNMPYVAGGVTVVIQKGRWRKVQNVVLSGGACGTTNITAAATFSFGTAQSDPNPATHIPSNNIPKFAVTSGGADAIQCLFTRLGIANSEFTNYNAATPGRVNLFRGADGSGTANTKFASTPSVGGGASFPNETTLYGNSGANTADTSVMEGFDGVVLSCTGASDSGGSPYSGYTDDMYQFVNQNGGKVFASHWHHSWLHHGPGVWPNLATWNDGASQCGTEPCNTTDTINAAATPDGPNLSAWLGKTSFNVVDARFTVTSITAAGVDLIDTSDNSGTSNTGSHTQYASWLMPVADATHPTTAACGRFVLSDLHVSGASKDNTSDKVVNCSTGNTDNSGNCVSCPAGYTWSGNNQNCRKSGSTSVAGTIVASPGFPNNCTTGALTDQEKVLAYMIFDLTSCVSPPTPPASCTKKTCASYPGTCGPQSDGCGGLTPSCGTCTGNQSCGSGGTPGVCGSNACTPKTCTTGCGTIPDGCGGVANCPACTGSDTCGGGGVANQCGHATCVATSCVQQGVECGQTGDGCGNILTCPACPAGTTCGGGGVANKCGKPACTPLAVCPAGKNCGDYPDGCGGSIHCGDCAAGQTCGGGGTANVCGQGTCTAKSCAQLGAQCGTVSDGCGGVTKCADCPQGDFCNAQNLCVAPTCTPKSCTQIGANCGQVADGCGGLTTNCGTCTGGTACGAGGTPGVCGTAKCTPKSCTDLDAFCGQVADGCGGLTSDCGACTGNTSCKNGACVVACTPTTCTAAGAQCGFISDGCGNALDCGSCPSGEVCGFNNNANKCGTDGPK